MQALFRGALVRRKRWPEIVKWHIGAIKLTDKLIDNYIEDTFLPDLILEIITKNRVYENLDLYSVENRILYGIRATMIENVIRNEVRASMRVA
jgi:hypothetical protein